ncbi:MAG: hypothetical protein ACK2UW_02940 [Anaerolineales bacterium]|jgi:hypothetical protein
MLKKIVIVGLVLFVLAAAGASAYNTGVFAAFGGPAASDSSVSSAALAASVAAAGAPGGQGPAWQAAGEAEAPASAGQGIRQQDRLQAADQLQDPTLDSVDLSGAVMGAGPAANAGNTGQGSSSQGNGRGYRGGNQGNAASPETARSGSGVPQAELPAWESYHGVVQSVDATGFNLLADDGQVLWVDSGNQNFVQSLGMNLEPGEALTVTGYWVEDTFTAGQIQVDASAAVYQLRDDYGRPLWAGGPRNN